MKYILTQTFKEGDRICHVKNWPGQVNGFVEPILWPATNGDVEDFSGKNGWYVMEVNEELKPLYTEEEVKELCEGFFVFGKHLDTDISPIKTIDHFERFWDKNKKK